MEMFIVDNAIGNKNDLNNKKYKKHFVFLDLNNQFFVKTKYRYAAAVL